MSFTNWNPVQACLWIASQDDAAVASLPEGCTFARMAFEVDLEGDALIGPRPGWIASAQTELLGACYAGALTMTGRSLYGGLSQEIPAATFATLRFHERDGADCLGPPNLADADCWCDLVVQADHVRAAFERVAMRVKATAPQCGAAAVTPPPKANGQQQRPSKPTPEMMESWYRRRVADHDSLLPPPSRTDDAKAAKDHFRCGGLKELVRAVRNKYAPAAWKEAGPKGRKVKARADRATATAQPDQK